MNTERTVAEDLRDFGQSFEVDGKRIDPARVRVHNAFLSKKDMEQALRLIVEWNPPQVESRGEMVPMGVAIGSNGVRDYFRQIAQEALAAHESRAQPASVAGWQPIETAPRTGRTLILLLTPSGWPQVAYSNTWWVGGFSVECQPTKWAPIPQPLASENVCSACEGTGYITKETPNMLIESPCPKCNGEHQ